MIQKIIFMICFLSLTSCAVGPLVMHETARSNGKGNNDFVGGYGMAGYVAKWSIGVTEDLDIGVQWESLSLGIRGKYAFINNQESGFSLSAAAGIGTSIGGNYSNVDLIVGYLTEHWEPYFTARFVHVKTDPIEFRTKDPNTAGLDFTINGVSYNYGQAILGTRFWLNKNWALSAEVSTLFELSNDFQIEDNLLAGAAVAWRF